MRSHSGSLPIFKILLSNRTYVKPKTKCQPEPVEGYLSTKTGFDKLNLRSLFYFA